MGKAIFKMICEIFRVIPGLGALQCLLSVLHALSMAMVVVLTQRFFDSAGRVAAGAPASEAVLPLAAFLLGTVAMEACNGLANFPFEFLSPKMLASMNGKLHKKAAEMGAVAYEDPAFLDCLEKAQEGIECGLEAALYMLYVFAFYIPYYAFMAVYLKSLSPWLVLVLLCVFLPVAVSKLLRFRIFAGLEEDADLARRAMGYYEKAICEREFYKDMRLLGAFGYLMALFRQARDAVNRETWKAEVRHARIELFLRLLTVAGYVGILLILVRELLYGRISAGAFAAVFSGMGMMFALAEEVFGGILQTVSQDAASIANYQKFLELPFPESQVQGGQKKPQWEAEPNGKRKGMLSGMQEQNGKAPDVPYPIRLEDVSFCYPGAERPAICGISCEIPKGETVAVVGENGSGKTTLVKLMLGIYQPTEGRVLLHGMDTREAGSWRARAWCSAVFQQFQKYRMDLWENVAISSNFSAEGGNRVCAQARLGQNRKERILGQAGPGLGGKGSALEQACKDAEVDLGGDTFPDGLETMLSREFGGVDISGGQWQRVATARGLYREHKVIALDEPTSAIDPIEETRVYRKFAALSKEKTAIIVTHRIGAAKIADRILVMKEGKVDDVGTHAELMERNGLYAAMFREQAKWYKDL